MEWWEKLTEVERILYRELYKKDFYEFLKEFWNTFDPAPFVDGLLMQYYCEVFQYMCRNIIDMNYKDLDIKLPPVTDELNIIDVRQNKRNLNINVPPRHSKSGVMNIAGPTFLFINSPIKAVSISHAQHLANKMNTARQKMINSPKFKFFFPEIVLEANSNTMLRDTRGGELYSLNRSSLTGYGCSVGLVDDLVSADMARKDKAELNSAWQFYVDTLPSRLNSTDKSIIINICQRLSPSDITGRILENPKLAERYTFVVLPAIFEKDTLLVFPISGKTHLFKKGDFLWPERFGDYSGLRAEVGEAVFQTQYLQKPIASDKTVFKEDMIIEKDKSEVPDISESEIMYVSTDFAVKDDTSNDYTGSVIGYKIGSTLYLCDAMEKRLNFIKSCNYVKQVESLYPGIIHIVEDKANGSAIIASLRDAVPGIQSYNPGAKGKIERAELATPYLNNVIFVRNKFDTLRNKFVLNDGLFRLKERMLAFPFVDHDDVVDAFTQLILFVFLDRRYMVYGRSFNDANIISDGEVPYDYSAVFFNRDGDNVKALEVGVKYGSINSLVALRETCFKANAHDTIVKLKEFARSQSVAIDCSAMDSMSGMYGKNMTIERYEIEDFNKSVTELNLAFSKKRIKVNERCVGLKGDIENFKYDNTKDDNARYRSYKDGFVACLRVAMKYYGGI